MTTMDDRPVGSGPVTGDRIASDTPRGNWLDVTDWWCDPRLAYAAGLSDGYRRGWEEATARADMHIVEALNQALGGPGCTDRRQAVRTHQRALDQKKARDEWDATASTARPGEYTGGPVDWGADMDGWETGVSA